MKITYRILAFGLGLATVLPQGVAQEAPVPRLVQQDGRHALLVDGAPFLMLAAEVNNSSGWPGVLPRVWPAMEDMHANTVLIPVYWDQIEPQPGQFDFSVVDTLLAQAREHRLRLVLLWFATWKNGNQHYMPEWMKLDPARYPHLVDKNGEPVDSPSPFATAALEADRRAFAAFMSHLKDVDPQRTVVMVQVENEPGTWECARDYSPTAERLFAAPVPVAVLTAMKKPAGGSWTEVFGPAGEVYFHAWHVASYVGQVAAAGKAVYPLPLYANAAQRDVMGPETAGNYGNGGPTDNVIPIWKAAAPALDMVSPDNYNTDTAAYKQALRVYRRDDNALFVPETGGSPRFFFFALGEQAIGFSPFGMDYTKDHVVPEGTRPNDELLHPWALTGTRKFVAPWAANYRLIEPMAREIARLNFEGRLQAVAEEPGRVTETLAFGEWEAVVSYGVWARYARPAGNPHPIGSALVAQLADHQFLVAGFFSRVDFRPRQPGKHRQFLRVEEGAYENGVFKVVRILNGDQTDGGLDFNSEPLVLRISVATY